MPLLNQYPVFEADQILTNDHLNQLVSYLDGQARVTRFRLIGKGILCGLEPSNNAASITLSAGYGLSSDGYLMELLTAKTYTLQAPYVSPKEQLQEDLPAFLTDPNLNVMEVFDAANADDQALPQFANAKPLANVGNLNQYAVVLFLEICDKHKENCVNDCDEHGITRKLRVVSLLVPKAAFVAKAAKQKLNKVRLRRMVSVANFSKSTDVAAAYRQISLLDVNPKANRTILAEKLDEIIAQKAPEALGFANNNIATFQDDLKKFKQTDFSGNNSQYYYSFLNDLERALNEFVTHYNCACDNPCFSKDEFKRHLIVGNLPFAHRDTIRHYWMSSTASASCDCHVGETKQLLERIFVLLRAFRAQNAFPNQAIRITPNKSSSDNLGQRAIPFYYNQAIVPNFRTLWVADCCQNDGQNEVYSYDDNVNWNLSNLSEYGNFRIEGHIGKKIGEAYSSILNQIRSNNLPIRLIALGVVAEKDFVGVRFPDWIKEYQVMNGVDIKDLQFEAKKMAKDYLTTVTPVAQKEKAPGGADKALLNYKVSKLNTAVNRVVFDSQKVATSDMIGNLSDLVNESKTVYKAAKSVPFQGTKLEELTFVQKIIDSNFPNYFIGIYNELEARLLNSMLFTKFVKRYNGLEHTGGVQAGGTFVLVFGMDKKLDDNGTVIADFSLPYYIDQILDESQTGKS
ncbi:MAG: hypothetical protein U0Y10_20845 [Spirosomataceae bacterium]